MKNHFVHTPCGPVQGAAGGADGVSVFRGIRYATAGRWEYPRQVTHWDGVYDAANFGACSFQPRAFYNEEDVPEKAFYYNEFRRGEHYDYSEDCLFLNIWAPDDAKNAPVLFYIHGGGFLGGCGHEKHFDGTAWCKKGVVAVTINYRLGPMGFLCLPELAARDGHTGNYAMFDQMAALCWVRDNIAAFGGDPDNVTIFGQSAGAVSCRMLMTSPLTKGKGLFRRAIIQSGCSLNEPEPYRTSDWIGEWAEKTLDSLGLSYEDLLTKDACELARTMPLRSYQLFTGMENPKFPKKPAMFTPCLDNYSLTAVPGVSLYCGEYDQDIDIICGTVADDILQPVKHCFEPIRDNAAVMRTVAYSPSVVMGRRQIETERKPIYAYFFERNIAGIDSFSGKSGPYHGSEIAYEFGTLELMEHDFTEYDYQLSEAIMDYWTNFAKNGNPNGGMLPKWTPFTAESPCNMNFRDDGFQMRNLIDSPKAERIIRVMQSCPGCIEALPDYI